MELTKHEKQEAEKLQRWKITFAKRTGLATVIVLAGWYGYYAGKTNTDHWWKEQPPLRHALIIRPLPSEKIVDEPCAVTVDHDSVLTILPNGTVSLNQTKAGVRNCQFQWVDVRQ